MRGLNIPVCAQVKGGVERPSLIQKRRAAKASPQLLRHKLFPVQDMSDEETAFCQGGFLNKESYKLVSH